MICFAYTAECLNYQVKQPNCPAPNELIPEQQIKKMIYKDILESIRSIFMHQSFLKIYPVPSFKSFKPIKLETNDAKYFQIFETLPDGLDSKIMHQAIAAYYSDYILLTASLSPHGVSYAIGDVRSTSLDHIIYFHHDLKVDG